MQIEYEEYESESDEQDFEQREKSKEFEEKSFEQFEYGKENKFEEKYDYESEYSVNPTNFAFDIKFVHVSSF